MDKITLDYIEEPLFPRNAVTYWSMFLTLELGAVLLSSMLVLPLNWTSFWDATFGYGIAALVLTPLCLIFARTQLGYFQAKYGRVVFDGDDISIYPTNDPEEKPDNTGKTHFIDLALIGTSNVKRFFHRFLKCSDRFFPCFSPWFLSFYSCGFHEKRNGYLIA